MEITGKEVSEWLISNKDRLAFILPKVDVAELGKCIYAVEDDAIIFMLQEIQYPEVKLDNMCPEIDNTGA